MANTSAIVATTLAYVMCLRNIVGASPLSERADLGAARELASILPQRASGHRLDRWRATQPSRDGDEPRSLRIMTAGFSFGRRPSFKKDGLVFTTAAYGREIGFGDASASFLFSWPSGFVRGCACRKRSQRRKRGELVA